MNIAFSTVLIFILVSPGILLRKSYLSGKFSKKYISTHFIDEVAWAIIPGLILNILGYYIVNLFIYSKVSLSDIACLLTDVNEPSIIRQIFSNINDHLLPISIYFTILWGVAVLLGHLARVVVRRRKWDKKYHWLRFSNEWYYFFKGEYVEIYGDRDLVDIDFLISEVLVDIGGGRHILYIGFVTEFFMAKDGGLDSIYLKYPIKKDYDNFKASKESEIGDLLMIPFKTVINISIKYLKIKDDNTS